MTSGASADVLLQGLSLFLGQTVRPALDDKGLAFRVRIAQHLAMSMALEMSLAEPADRAALVRLHALGMSDDADTPTASQAAAARAAAEARLARTIRDGGDIDTAAVRRHVEQGLRDELAYTNPRFDLTKDLP